MNPMTRYSLCVSQKFPFNGTSFVVFRTANRGATRQYLADDDGVALLIGSESAAKAAMKVAAANPAALWTAETRMPA